MEKCKYCGHVGVGESGIVRKKQQYKSLECRHTMCEIDLQTKKEKLQLHYILRGNGFRRIARILTHIYGKLLHNQMGEKNLLYRYQDPQFTSQWM